MPQNGFYSNYSQNKVQTANRKQLVIMLFEGMSKFLKQTLRAFEAKDLEGVHIGIQKTNKILLELLSTLNEEKGREVAKNLKDLYIYCYETLVIGNLKKEKEKIEEVSIIIDDLTKAWQTALRKADKGSALSERKSLSIAG